MCLECITNSRIFCFKLNRSSSVNEIFHIHTRTSMTVMLGCMFYVQRQNNLYIIITKIKFFIFYAFKYKL